MAEAYVMGTCCRVWLPDLVLPAGDSLRKALEGEGGRNFAHLRKKWPMAKLSIFGKASVALPPWKRLQVVTMCEDPLLMDKVEAEVVDLAETACDIVADFIGLDDDQVQLAYDAIRIERHEMKMAASSFAPGATKKSAGAPPSTLPQLQLLPQPAPAQPLGRPVSLDDFKPPEVPPAAAPAQAPAPAAPAPPAAAPPQPAPQAAETRRPALKAAAAAPLQDSMPPPSTVPAKRKAREDAAPQRAPKVARADPGAAAPGQRGAVAVAAALGRPVPAKPAKPARAAAERPAKPARTAAEQALSATPPATVPPAPPPEAPAAPPEKAGEDRRLARLAAADQGRPATGLDADAAAAAGAEESGSSSEGEDEEASGGEGSESSSSEEDEEEDEEAPSVIDQEAEVVPPQMVKLYKLGELCCDVVVRYVAGNQSPEKIAGVLSIDQRAKLDRCREHVQSAGALATVWRLSAVGRRTAYTALCEYFVQKQRVGLIETPSYAIYVVPPEEAYLKELGLSSSSYIVGVQVPVNMGGKK